MDLTNLTPEQLNALRAIAAQMNTTLEELLNGHQDVNALLEAHKGQQFGMLNEYDNSSPQMLND